MKLRLEKPRILHRLAGGDKKPRAHRVRGVQLSPLARGKHIHGATASLTAHAPSGQAPSPLASPAPPADPRTKTPHPPPQYQPPPIPQPPPIHTHAHAGCTDTTIRRWAHEQYAHSPHTRSPLPTISPHPRHLRHLPGLGTFPGRDVSPSAAAGRPHLQHLPRRDLPDPVRQGMWRRHTGKAGRNQLTFPFCVHGQDACGLQANPP
jgi:hypothetical protein